METRNDIRDKILDGLVPEPEFARAFCVNLRTVRRWRKLGLPSVKRGRLVLIPIAAANGWFACIDAEARGRGRPRKAA